MSDPRPRKKVKVCSKARKKTEKPRKPRMKAKVKRLTNKDMDLGILTNWRLTCLEAHYGDCPRCLVPFYLFFKLYRVMHDESRCTVKLYT